MGEVGKEVDDDVGCELGDGGCDRSTRTFNSQNPHLVRDVRLTDDTP